MELITIYGLIILEYKRLLNATSNIDENDNFISKVNDNSEEKKDLLADQLSGGLYCIYVSGLAKMTLIQH